MSDESTPIRTVTAEQLQRAREGAAALDLEAIERRLAADRAAWAREHDFPPPQDIEDRDALLAALREERAERSVAENLLRVERALNEEQRAALEEERAARAAAVDEAVRLRSQIALIGGELRLAACGTGITDPHGKWLRARGEMLRLLAEDRPAGTPWSNEGPGQRMTAEAVRAHIEALPAAADLRAGFERRLRESGLRDTIDRVGRSMAAERGEDPRPAGTLADAEEAVRLLGRMPTPEHVALARWLRSLTREQFDEAEAAGRVPVGVTWEDVPAGTLASLDDACDGEPRPGER